MSATRRAQAATSPGSGRGFGRLGGPPGEGRDDAVCRLEIVEALLEADAPGELLASAPLIIALLRHEQERHGPVVCGRPDQADIAGALRTLKRRLYLYQRAGARRFLAAGRLVLADDMGLAKTAQATAAAYVLFRTGKVRRGPLIVPASLKDQWLRQTECLPTRSARKAVDHSLVLCKPSDRRPDRPVALVHI